MKRILTIVVIVGLLGLIAWKLSVNKKEIDAKAKPRNLGSNQVAVQTATVGLSNAATQFTVLGTLVPVKEIKVLAQSAGRVTRLTVELGDHVTKGQKIGYIDNDIKNLAIQNSINSFNRVETEYKRMQALFQGGAATEQQLLAARTDYENAKNAVSQARKNLTDAVILAPITGTVSHKGLEEGSYANIGAEIVTVININQLKVQVNVAEADVYNIALGQKVSIGASVYPGKTFSGTISYIAGEGDAAHNYLAEVVIDNPAATPLKAGTYVNVNFTTSATGKVITIPRAALYGSAKDGLVYTVRDGRAYSAKVTVLKENNDTIVVGNGLKEGDVVVVTGQINLADSSAVNIIK